MFTVQDPLLHLAHCSDDLWNALTPNPALLEFIPITMLWKFAAMFWCHPHDTHLNEWISLMSKPARVDQHFRPSYCGLLLFTLPWAAPALNVISLLCVVLMWECFPTIREAAFSHVNVSMCTVMSLQQAASLTFKLWDEFRPSSLLPYWRCVVAVVTSNY